ncbi:MAG: M56 family metallopeptidase [Clostridia bacterium]|nr:M56 family metallopeptidase [Clostridia bacterium]
MTAVFLKILNMSITGAVIAAAVLLLRPMLKRAPRALVCALWLLVGLRLLVPFTFESPMSLMPANDTVTESSDGSISVNTGIGFINSALSTPQTPPQSIILPEGFTPPTVIPDSSEPSNGTVTIPDAEEGSESERSVSAVDIAAIVWASGTVLMVIYAAVSYLRIRLRVRESVKVEKSIFICDRIDSPFILGVIRPRIYMPSDTPAGDTPYIISHERAHLKRLDHLWKPLGFLLLSLHWFNPVMWISYIMLCRDIELACDEKVIRAMGEEAKKPYSDALISASSPRRLISACPLAFGEVGVKKRIKAVLSYKKPTLWIIIAAVLALCIVAACFLTSRKADENEPPFCIEAQNSASDMDGVWAEITKTDTENGKMTVVWHNDTEKELIFGEEFYIYRVEENGQTVDTYTFSEEFAWNLIGYPVAPGGTFEKEYNVSEHEILKDTPHRYETYFHISGDNPVPHGLEKYAVIIDFVTSESFIPESTKPAESDTPDLPTSDVLNSIEKVEAADDVKCTITLSGYTEEITVEGDVAKALYREVASSITDNEKHFNVPNEQSGVGLSFTVNGFENSYYFRVFDNDTVQTELPIHTTICKGYALKSGSYEKIKAMVEGHFDGVVTFPSIEPIESLNNFTCVISFDGYEKIVVKDEAAKTLYSVIAEASKGSELVSYPFTDNRNHNISLTFAVSDNISKEEPYPEEAQYLGVFHIGDNDTVIQNISPFQSFRETCNYPDGTYEKVKAMVGKYTVGIPSEYHVGTWAKNAGQDYETLNISSLSNNAVSFSVTVSNQYKSIFIVEATAHEKDGKYYFGEDVSTRFEAPDGLSGYLEFTPDGIIMTIDSLGVIAENLGFDKVHRYTEKLSSDAVVYTCLGTKEALPPSLTLFPTSGQFTFTYSYLSSYIAHGTYELTDETLTLRTSDGLYTYVFDVEGNAFIFDEPKSSPLPKYKYSADAAEALPPFGDGAKFTKVLDNTNYIPTSISIGEALSTVYPDTVFDKESVVKIFLDSDEYDGEYANVEDSETISKIIGTIKSAPLVKYETIDAAPGAGAPITFYGDGSTVIFRAYVDENKVVFNHSNVFTTNDGYFAELCELIESLQYDPEKAEPASLEDVVSETTELLKDYGWTDITVVDGEVDTLALVGRVITPEYMLESNERLTSITAKGSYTIASKTCKYYVIIRIAENSEAGSARLVETIYPYRNMQGNTLAEFVKNYNKRGEILRADDSDLAFALTSDTNGYDAYEYYFDIDPYNEAYACTKFNEKYIPMVYLNTENGTFSFPYSKRSFYLPKGHYERTNTSLTLRTDDGLYIYVFKIAADGTLKFDAASSSAFPEYKSSEKHGNVLTPFDDGTVFTKVLDSDQ